MPKGLIPLTQAKLRDWGIQKKHTLSNTRTDKIVCFFVCKDFYVCANEIKKTKKNLVNYSENSCGLMCSAPVRRVGQFNKSLDTQ